jgi:hypothetical protein
VNLSLLFIPHKRNKHTVIIDSDNEIKPNLIIISCQSRPVIPTPAMGIISEPAPQNAANKVVNQFVKVPNRASMNIHFKNLPESLQDDWIIPFLDFVILESRSR